jgi:hypothetical protein
MKEEHMKEMREAQVELMFEAVLDQVFIVLGQPKNLSKGSLVELAPRILRSLTDAQQECCEARTAYMQKEKPERILLETTDMFIQSLRALFHLMVVYGEIPENKIRRIIGGH